MHLFVLVLPRKQWDSAIQLNQDATERPHVNSCCVLDSKYDFGGTIEPRLNVSVDLFPLKAATAHINHFYPTFVFFFHKYILGFEVAVDNPISMKEIQGLQNLNCKPSNQI